MNSSVSSQVFQTIVEIPVIWNQHVSSQSTIFWYYWTIVEQILQKYQNDVTSKHWTKFNHRAVDDEISFLFVTCSNQLRILDLTPWYKSEPSSDKLWQYLYISDENKVLAWSDLYVTDDRSFVMKSGLSRLSTDYAWFLVVLNPGNWKWFNFILALIGFFDIISWCSINEEAVFTSF